MSSYKKLTLKEVESLQEKNATLTQDLKAIDKLDKIINELKNNQEQYLEEKKNILDKYKSIYGNGFNTSLTNERFIVYSPCRIDRANLKIHKVDGKQLVLTGCYHYGQCEMEIIIPDYEEFISKGYYKGTITLYEYDYPYIVVNEYTNETMKEIIYMYLHEELQSLIRDKQQTDKDIQRYTERSKKLAAEIQSYHDIPDSKIRKMFVQSPFFSNQDSFMDSLPRKIDVFDLLKTSEVPQ